MSSSNLVKFIHASDVHLGCQQYRNISRSNDFIRVFQEILSIAISRNVDFILLGGDVFTSIDMLPGHLNQIIQILTKFKEITNADIPIIAIEGNHDLRRYSRGMRYERGQSWLKILANLGLIILLDADLEAPPEKMFLEYDYESKRGGKIKIKNIIIYGTRYLGEKPTEYILKIKRAIQKNEFFFHILLQHFGIEGQLGDIPGIDLKYLLPLKDCVNYLGLGHFHLQFILNDWIFNPGSAEATSIIDTSYKRGIFYVEVLKNKSFTKMIYKIRLPNRKHIWQNIYFHKPFKNREDIYNYVIKKLETLLRYLNPGLKPLNLQMPVLCLILKGKKPMKCCKVNKKELVKLICEKFPVVDVRIYEKFKNNIIKIDAYLQFKNK